MPYYDYFCNDADCQTTFELFLPMSRVYEPTENPCPKCGKKTILKEPSAPMICDPVRLGVKKAPAEFDKYVLGKIKARHPKHSMGNTKVSHAKEI